MSPNEKVRERHGRNRHAGLRHPPFSILTVGSRALVSGGCGHVEDLDAPTAYPVGYGRWVCVSYTNLGQANRIDGRAATRDRVGDRLPRPLAKRRVRVEGVNEHVGVQKDHGFRVSSRSFSHVIVGRRGALRMASRHALLLMRWVPSGF